MSIDADLAAAEGRSRPYAYGPPEAPVSWAAVFAGAVAALAASSVLTILAAGFGLALAADAIEDGRGGGAFTPALGAGAVAVQVISAALGGYLAGRLRPHWRLAHTDESHFRDTAHGLLAWAVATLVGGALIALSLSPGDGGASAAAAAGAAAPAAAPSAAEIARGAGIAAQTSLFLGVGLLLSAFIAAVSARLGGMRAEAMQARAAL